MVTEINHDTFCFNAQRCVSLRLDERVRPAVAARAALERLAQWKAAANADLPASEFIRAGRIEMPPAPDFRRALADALTSGTPAPALARTVERMLDRFRADCAARASQIALELPPVCTGDNPFDAGATRGAVLDRLASIRDNALARQAQSAQEAAAHLDRFNRLASVTIAPPANPLLARLTHRAHLWLGPLLGAGVGAWSGQNNWNFAWFTLLGAAVGGAIQYFRPSRAGSPEPTAGAARPTIDSLASHAAAMRAAIAHAECAARASALIRSLGSAPGNPLGALEAELETLAYIPPEPLVEARPGCVLLTGKIIVDALLDSRRDRLDRIPPSAAGSAVTIMSAASEAIGPITISDAMQIMANDPITCSQLDYHLRHNLELLARSVMNVRPGVGINRSLCPEFLSIGLPAGDKDPLVPFVRRAFPGAGIITGSSPDGLEITYRAHNLTRGHLALHERSTAAYANATSLERALWHFPRRLPALM